MKRQERQLLQEAEDRYIRSRPKKWLVAIVFCMVGVVVGYWIPVLNSALTKAKYNRAGMDNMMHSLLGDITLKDVVPHELVIAAYAYNQQEPRFFSKFFQWEEFELYNVSLSNATGSSAAAPTFFDPNNLQNGYGFVEQLVDGGVICNNPAYYAYQMATKIYGKNKVRVLSIGTGEPPFKPVEPEKFGKAQLLTM